MRRWFYSMIALSFVLGSLTGCAGHGCFTAGVCDCEIEDQCAHRAPWASGPVSNPVYPGGGTGGCGSGACGGGSCGTGGCANGSCGGGYRPVNQTGPCTYTNMTTAQR